MLLLLLLSVNIERPQGHLQLFGHWLPVCPAVHIGPATVVFPLSPTRCAIFVRIEPDIFYMASWSATGILH